MIAPGPKAVATAVCLLSAVFCQAGERSQLITHLEAGERQVVVAYGTSLTAGGAWVRQMQDVLDKRYPGLATVINSGGPGQWSEWGVRNLDGRVIEKKPDCVFIEFSINDSVERFKGSPRIARVNLETMIERIRKARPECEIILMTMTPGDKHPEGHRSHRKEVAAHYEMYRSVARQRGLCLIDHYPHWIELRKTDPELFARYLPDSIHPTVEGWAKIGTPVILDALGIGAVDQGPQVDAPLTATEGQEPDPK